MKIELLVVPDCPHAAAAADLVTTAVADTGVGATITHTIIATEDQARERGFTGSPTILLNGSDPFDRHVEPVALSCRLYWTPEGPRAIPTLRDLRQALKRVAAGCNTPGARARSAAMRVVTPMCVPVNHVHSKADGRRPRGPRAAPDARHKRRRRRRPNVDYGAPARR